MLQCCCDAFQTPLHLAVVTGDCELVRLLLSAGASPNIADRKGQNCFHLSVQYQHTDCLQCLFTYCSESQPDIMNYEGTIHAHKHTLFQTLSSGSFFQFLFFNLLS